MKEEHKTETGATIVDRRSWREQLSHTCYIKARDVFLGGWGEAPGRSLCMWCCKPQHAAAVLAWVRGRSEMRDVKLYKGKEYKPRLRRGDHFSIYVVNDGHPALTGEKD